MYRWQENGKTKSVYSMDLGELREKEFQIQKDIKDGINSYKRSEEHTSELQSQR